jgi:hypothetical protein
MTPSMCVRSSGWRCATRASSVSRCRWRRVGQPPDRLGGKGHRALFLGRRRKRRRVRAAPLLLPEVVGKRFGGVDIDNRRPRARPPTSIPASGRCWEPRRQWRSPPSRHPTPAVSDSLASLQQRSGRSGQPRRGAPPCSMVFRGQAASSDGPSSPSEHSGFPERWAEGVGSRAAPVSAVSQRRFCGGLNE